MIIILGHIAPYIHVHESELQGLAALAIMVTYPVIVSVGLKAYDHLKSRRNKKS